MIVPSKELFKEITGEEIYEVYGFDGYESIDYIGADTNNHKISIYKLQHLMKEWMYKLGGMDLYSGKSIVEEVYTCFYYDGGDMPVYFKGVTEFESICRACEWKLRDRHV